jgi:hypothetical protein
VPRADFDEVIDSIAGIVATYLNGMAARCSSDLAVRRKIDAVVHQVRKEIAKVCLDEANRCSAPAPDGV